MADSKDADMKGGSLTVPETTQSLCRHFTINDVLSDRHTHALYTVKASDTVEDTLKVMKKHRILSVPVEDSKIKGMIIGLAGITDIATATVFAPIFETYNTDSKLSELDKSHADAVFNDVFNNDAFSRSVLDVLGLSSEPQMMLNNTDTLYSLLQHFHKGAHRALVRRSDCEPHIVLVSQTDVSRFIQAMSVTRPELRRLLDKTVQELGLSSTPNPLLTIRKHSTALTGFRRMLQAGIGALPVVDDVGKVIATLSLSDLRGLDKETFHRVLFNVMEYLQMHHTFTQPGVTFPLDDTKDMMSVIPPPVTARPTEPLGAVIARMVDAKVHRAWVIDHDVKPVGVVTHTDLMTLFSSHNEADAANVETS